MHLFRLAPAVVLSLLVAAQDVDIHPRFIVGDEFTLSMTHTVSETLSPPRSISLRRSVQVRVIATGPEGTRIQWRSGPVELKGTPVGTDARMTVATIAATDQDFLLDLDARGQFRQVRNVAALSESLERALKEARNRFPAADAPELARLVPLNAVAAASTIAREAQIWTGFHGTSVPIGKDIDLAESIRVPGGQLPGVRRVRIVAADEATIEATMVMTIDRQALRKLLPKGESFPLEIDMTEDAKVVFDRRIGLHRSGAVQTTAISGPDKRIDAWEFSLAEGPKRKNP